MKYLWLLAAVSLLGGCVSPQVSGAFLGGYRALDVSGERITNTGGHESASVDVDPDDGFGLGGRIEVRGKIRPDRDNSSAWLNGLLVGLALDVDTSEIESNEVNSVWVHDHSHKGEPSFVINRTSVVDFSMQTVSLSPKLLYQFECVRPYVQAGPSIVFTEIQGDYYGSPSESDTSIGFDGRLGAEIPVTDVWGALVEYNAKYTRPSYYYVEGSKFESDVWTHGVNLGVYCLW